MSIVDKFYLGPTKRKRSNLPANTILPVSRIFPSLFPFPVTFSEFLKYTHWNEPLEKIICDLEKCNEAAYKILRVNRESQRQLLHDYYEVFYIHPEVRKRYPLRLKPCPAIVKQKLLIKPNTVDVVNSPKHQTDVAKKPKVLLKNLKNVLSTTIPHLANPEIGNTISKEPNPNSSLATSSQSFATTNALENINASEPKNLIFFSTKFCLEETFIRRYIEACISLWCKETKKRVCNLSRKSQIPTEQIENNTAKVHIQSIEILAPLTTSTIINLTSAKKITKSQLPKVRVKKHCSLAYMLRMSTGLKQRILKSVLEMSFTEFKQYANINSTQNGNDLATLEHCYQIAIIEQSIWPPYLYIRLIDLIKYLQSKEIIQNQLKLCDVSPKLLQWQNLAECTDFNKCVNLDYIKCTAHPIHSSSVLQKRSEIYYRRCWVHERWLWREPNIINSSIIAQLESKNDFIINQLSTSDKTIIKEAASLESFPNLFEFFKMKAQVRSAELLSTKQKSFDYEPTTKISATANFQTEISENESSTYRCKYNETENEVESAVAKSQQLSEDNSDEVLIDDLVQKNTSTVCLDQKQNGSEEENRNYSNTINQSCNLLEKTQSIITSTQNLEVDQEKCVSSQFSPPHNSKDISNVRTTSPNCFLASAESTYLPKPKESLVQQPLREPTNYSYIDMPNTQAQINALPEEVPPILNKEESMFLPDTVTIKQEFPVLSNLQFIIDDEEDNDVYRCVQAPTEVVLVDDIVENPSFSLGVQRSNDIHLESELEKPPLLSLSNLATSLQNCNELTVSCGQRMLDDNLSAPPTTLAPSLSLSAETITTTGPIETRRSAKVTTARVIDSTQTINKGKNVPQLTHEFRALPVQVVNRNTKTNDPILSDTLKIAPATTIAIGNQSGLITISQALATDCSLFSNDLLQTVETQITQSTPLTCITTTPITTTTTTTTTINNENFSNTDVQQVNTCDEVLLFQQKFKILLYRTLHDFHYFHNLVEEQVVRYALPSTGLNRCYMQARISNGHKVQLRGRFLLDLFPSCPPQLFGDLLVILRDLNEFHYNKLENNISLLSDLRQRALFFFLYAAPAFSYCILKYDDLNHTSGHCETVRTTSTPCSNRFRRHSLTTALKPAILNRIIEIKKHSHIGVWH